MYDQRAVGAIACLGIEEGNGGHVYKPFARMRIGVLILV